MAKIPKLFPNQKVDFVEYLLIILLTITYWSGLSTIYGSRPYTVGG